MSDPVLPLKEARRFLSEEGIDFDINAIEVSQEVPKRLHAAVRKGYFVEKLIRLGLLDKFIKQCWPEGSTERGQKKIAKYRQYREINEVVSTLEPEAEEDEQETSDFALKLEAHLRDGLANDLELIERGLKLYKKGDITGVEYQLPNGKKIDILAQDKGGNMVVIELKRDKGSYQALGQLLYYMGWVDQNIKKPCRGIIIAKEIGEELRVSASRVADVELFEYTLKLSLKRA